MKNAATTIVVEISLESSNVQNVGINEGTSISRDSKNKMGKLYLLGIVYVFLFKIKAKCTTTHTHTHRDSEDILK